jgi:hypothetical protein
MPQSVLPHEIYRTHMADAKLRILAAERLLGAPSPLTGFAALDMEFCFLQIRRVIESITFGAMIREELRYTSLRLIEKAGNSRDHGDASRDWQAPEILKRLVALSPHALPIPHKRPTAVSLGLFHFDRQKIEVNHGRLIDLYERCGGFLHARNPVGRDFLTQVNSERKKYVKAREEVRRALLFFRKLLWQHAAVTLEDSGPDDPRTPASAKQVWLVDFGTGHGQEVTILIAEAQ